METNFIKKMSEFWVYFQIGLHHVLDLNATDHLLFLVALTASFAFSDWKKVLLLTAIFTVGHTISLLLAVFGILAIKASFIELLIPITILLTALYNIFTSGKATKNQSINIIGFFTLFFGIVHGLGFSNYFKNLLPGNATDKLLPTLEFASGIEAAQILIVLTVLLLSLISQNLLRLSKRDFTLIVSSFVIGVVLPLILQHEIWFKK